MIKNPDISRFNPKTTFEFYDDFLSYLGLNWVPVGAGAGHYEGAGTAVNALSCGNTVTGTLAGNFSNLYQSIYLWFANTFPGAWTYSTRVLHGQPAAATTDFRIGIGAGMAVAGELANWIGFRQPGVGNWEAVTRAGGVETVIATGIAASNAVWRDFTFIVNQDHTRVDFYVNNLLIGSSTTNIPTGLLVSAFQAGTNTGGAANESLQGDFYYLRIDGLSR